MERVFAEYLIETPYDVEQASAVLAGEQSSGTFVSVPGETKELKKRFAARVEDIQLLDLADETSIPGVSIPGPLYLLFPKEGNKRMPFPSLMPISFHNKFLVEFMFRICNKNNIILAGYISNSQHY
jgi:hypothetical protein